MRQQSGPATGDVIRLEGVTKTYQADAPPALGDSGPAAGQGQGGIAPLGSALSVTGAPGAPALVVVGYANSITNTADGWVAPGEIARLRGPGASAGAQTLYRFARAGSYAQVGHGAAG